MTAPLDAARACLNQTFGFEDFRPSQVPVVESLISGRDVLAVIK